MLKILIVEDEPQLLSNLMNYLRLFRGEFDVLGAATGENCLGILERNPRVDVVLTDLCLPGMDGMEVVRRTVERWPRIRVIVMTSIESPEMESMAFQNGASGFFAKPLDLEKLVTFLRDIAASEQGCPGLVLDLDIFDLSRLFLSLRKTITVHVTAGRAKGTIVFISGVLTHVSTTGAKGVQAFIEMMRWKNRRFEVAPDADPDSYPPNVDISSIHLMIELARFRDEQEGTSLEGSQRENQEQKEGEG